MRATQAQSSNVMVQLLFLVRLMARSYMLVSTDTLALSLENMWVRIPVCW